MKQYYNTRNETARAGQLLACYRSVRDTAHLLREQKLSVLCFLLYLFGFGWLI